MHKIRLIIAICACKIGIFVSKLMGKKGSSMPGNVALKICPDIMTVLAKQVKKGIIAVCGTNGKTTTNNMIYTYLVSNGYSVVCNNVGANMIFGVCCAFAAKANIFGKLKADFACLEIDEASAVKVFKYFAPDKMIVTNLFRDQLDRYGEIDMTVDYLKRALDLAPKTELILNGDDPVSMQLGGSNRKCYYIGVDEKVTENTQDADDGRFCPECGEKLNYEYCHYSQLGKFICEKCGFKRKELDFKVKNVDLAGGIKFDIDIDGEKVDFDVNYRGFYNIYNIAVSYIGARLMMGKFDNYKEILSGYKPQTGRMEEFNIGKKVVLNLSKNPAGFNQGIATVFEDTKNEKVILLGINDNAGDGKDISWLWDVDFERFSTSDAKRYILCGMRVDDLALRLKYAGIPESKMKKFYSLKEAAMEITNGDEDICYALVNYTVVFKLSEVLKELEGGNTK